MKRKNIGGSSPGSKKQKAAEMVISNLSGWGEIERQDVNMLMTILLESERLGPDVIARLCSTSTWMMKICKGRPFSIRIGMREIRGNGINDLSKFFDEFGLEYYYGLIALSEKYLEKCKEGIDEGDRADLIEKIVAIISHLDLDWFVDMKSALTGAPLEALCDIANALALCEEIVDQVDPGSLRDILGTVYIMIFKRIGHETLHAFDTSSVPWPIKGDTSKEICDNFKAMLARIPSLSVGRFDPDFENE